MKKVIYIFIISIILLSNICTITVSAHSGRTDSNGGHYNNSTGEYHYHCGGNPAHQHYGGSCPYEKSNNKNNNSSGSSGYKPATNPSSSKSEKEDSNTTDIVVLVIFGVVLVGWIIYNRKGDSL
jgi:hypothetical protein